MAQIALQNSRPSKAHLSIECSPKLLEFGSHVSQFRVLCLYFKIFQDIYFEIL
eukprot:SAG31_NODE_1509_length_8062_cov_6.974884_2_plen_53_part_00